MSSDEEKPPAPPVRLTSNRTILNSSNNTSSLVGSTDTIDRPLPKEPDDIERSKKKTLKSKIKSSKMSSIHHNSDNKPNISYPTNFEHTVHVGFDAVTGEFTVNINIILIIIINLFKTIIIINNKYVLLYLVASYYFCINLNVLICFKLPLKVSNMHALTMYFMYLSLIFIIYYCYLIFYF